MSTQKNYGWLDLSRPFAALLVIAIHTSPLTSINIEADFFLTRVLARIAVPFFLMVSGQFILSGLFSDTREKNYISIVRFLKKLCLLYSFCIMLYLPLGIYAGHYKNLSFTGFLRMLVFDGTFYHLWYFPACILGSLILLLLSRFCSLRGALFFSVILYGLGLLGDSYFGLTQRIPLLNTVYDGMFHVFSYTRNGLFLAPLFLTLGVYAERRSACTVPKKILLYSLCLLLSFCAMAGEAFLLHDLGWQRHDSMYLFLPPVMLFLYLLLLSLPALPSRRMLRSVSLWLYILHPGAIVVVRGIAKPLNLVRQLVENCLLHFLAVACLSAAAAVLCSMIEKAVQTFFYQKQYGRQDLSAAEQLPRLPEPPREGSADSWSEQGPDSLRAWIELDMDALSHNVRTLQSLLPPNCRLMPAVKANAYGHGAVLIAKKLNQMGIHSFCIACAAEGIALREAGIQGEILILGYTPPAQFPLLQRFHLSQAVVDSAYAETLRQSGIPLHVHLAVDTGMHRIGIRCEEIEAIAAVCQNDSLIVDGIFTHLSASDSTAPECRAFTEAQLRAFFQVTEFLEKRGIPCKGKHLLASYGILHYPEAALDFVRPGIALYGVLSTEEDTLALNRQLPSPLAPVLSLKAKVVSVRTLHSGESAGYGLDYTAECEKRIAVLSIGYADGLPRELAASGGRVLINGKSAPIVGRICMDQLLADVTGKFDVSQGDTAVLIGTSGKETITVGEIAARCGTISNEILSRLGDRLERISNEKNL